MGSWETYERRLRQKGYDLQKHPQRSSPLLVLVVGRGEAKLVPLLRVGRQAALHPEIQRDIHYH